MSSGRVDRRHARVRDPETDRAELHAALDRTLNRLAAYGDGVGFSPPGPREPASIVGAKVRVESTP